MDFDAGDAFGWGFGGEEDGDDAVAAAEIDDAGGGGDAVTFGDEIGKKDCIGAKTEEVCVLD